MRVRANCNITHSGKRYVAGEEFEISNKDFSALCDVVTVLKAEKETAEITETVKTEPKKRKKKD